MQQASPGRFSGRQITVTVVAICAAVIMVPVGVYAAAVNKVAIADSSHPARTVTVDSQGRLKTFVSGSVRPAAPTAPFHRGVFVSNTSDQVIGARIPLGKSLAISSLHVNTFGNAPGLTEIVVLKALANGDCVDNGPLRGTVAAFHMSSEDTAWNFDRIFPVPQVWSKTNRAMCLLVVSPSDLFVVMDGYTY